MIVAAVADNGVIGIQGALPWSLPSDLRRFRSLTMGKPVIMGRKTFESIGRPLPGRTNIVVSRSMSPPDGVLVSGSLDDALHVAGRDRSVAEVCIIGGGEIYTQSMGIADALEITRVHASPDGDAVFPSIDPELWRIVAQDAGARSDKDSHATTYLTYVRKIDGEDGSGDGNRRRSR